jgi:hypothetical protein
VHLRGNEVPPAGRNLVGRNLGHPHDVDLNFQIDCGMSMTARENIHVQAGVVINGRESGDKPNIQSLDFPEDPPETVTVKRYIPLIYQQLWKIEMLWKQGPVTLPRHPLVDQR